MAREQGPTAPFRALTNRRIDRRRLAGVAAGSAAASMLAPFGTPALTTSLSPPALGSAAAQETAEPVHGGTLIHARNLDAKTLDPHFSAQWSERFALYAIFDTLVSWDSEFNITPGFAESWEIADDGTAITFLLPPGAKFHDGTDCDAAAVKWNIERVLDPEVNSPQRGQLEPAIASVEAVDPTTVLVSLKKPWRPLLAALGERPGFIVSPTAVEELGEDFARNPVGAGPFRFVEWVPDSHIVLERFDEYWDEGLPYLDRIEIRHVPDEQVQLTMVRTGEAHLIDEVDPAALTTLEDVPEVVVEEYNAWRWVGTHNDVDEPPFDNPDLRKALAYATDRELIKQVLYGGTGRVMTHPLAGGWAYDPALDELMQYDLDKAREHLDLAGAAGQTFTLTASNSRTDQDLAQLLQAMYQELGINVEIETVDASEAFALTKEDKTNWVPTNWTPRADPDGLLRILFHTDGFQNTTAFSNPEVDRLLDEAAAMFDTAAAAELYHEVERIVAEDASYVFMHAPAQFAAMRREVGGFVYLPDLVLRLGKMWLAS